MGDDKMNCPKCKDGILACVWIGTEKESAELDACMCGACGVLVDKNMRVIQMKTDNSIYG